jgi:hypothetical protein
MSGTAIKPLLLRTLICTNLSSHAIIFATLRINLYPAHWAIYTYSENGLITSGFFKEDIPQGFPEISKISNERMFIE